MKNLRIYWWSRNRVSTKQLEKFISALPNNEQRRAKSITHLPKKIEFVWGRMLLRTVLEKEYRLPFTTEIGVSDSGKPFIVGRDLQFSISHTHQHIALAIGGTTPLGLDIQASQKNKLQSLERIIRRYASTRELEQYESIKTKREKENFFYTIWTMKESYAKATAEGLNSKLEYKKPCRHYLLPKRKVYGAICVLSSKRKKIDFMTARSTSGQLKFSREATLLPQ